MTSLSQIPGTFERSVLNSPRMFEGASGFGSQISMWLGPPCRKTRMTDFAELKPRAPSNRDAPCACCHWKKFARFKPKRPTEPTRRSSRRVGPSHKEPLRPGIVSIVASSPVVQKCLAVHERPEQVLGPRRAARAAAEESRGGCHLAFRREPAERRQIQIFDHRTIVGARENQLRHAALG